MKIVIVTHEYPEDGAQHHGGIATYTALLAQLLHKYGHKITVLTLSPNYNDTIFLEGVRVERIKTPECLSKTKIILKHKYGEYIISALLIRNRLNRLCKDNKPDIIHYANFKSIGLFKRRDIPMVVRMSSDNALWREAFKENYSLNEGFSSINADDKLETFVNKKADGIFAPSNLVAEITKRRTNKDVRIIETPPSYYFLSIQADCLPEKLNGKKFFLYYGSLSRMKGVHIIIEAIKQLLQKLEEDYLFVFVGHDYGIGYGKEKQAFLEYAKSILGENIKYIVYYDYLEPARLKPIIEKSMCCVFPSRIDNLPNTCLEAMSLAKPIIATDGASFEQLLVNGKSGILTPIDDAYSLSNAMHKIIMMKEEERNKLGENAKERLSINSPDNIYKEIMAFYEEVIKKYNERNSY